MTKEINKVVTELKEVESSIKYELQQGSRVTTDEMNKLLNLVDLTLADYNNTVANLDYCNSLVVKFEKFIEVIGMIEYASVDNTQILDSATSSLLEVSKIIKQK